MLGSAYLIRLLYEKDDSFVLKSTIIPLFLQSRISYPPATGLSCVPFHLFYGCDFPKRVGKISRIKQVSFPFLPGVAHSTLHTGRG